MVDKSSLKLCIDQHADSLRERVVGDPVRAFEYQRAEAQARAFKAAGYAGVAPSCVEADVLAKGLTPTQACDGIIAAADGFLFILDSLRTIRLTAKAHIDNATEEQAEQIKDTAILQMTQLIEMAGIE